MRAWVVGELRGPTDRRPTGPIVPAEAVRPNTLQDGPVIDTVLLDLDGTLVDSAPGILSSLRAAFDELGLEWPGIGREVLGPPLYVTLPRFVGKQATPALVAAYRRHYATDGLRASPPFPGVPELLDELADTGRRLAVATSKAETYAVEIIRQQGLAGYFATVCGDTLDAARPRKADVISEALRRLGGSAAAVMVGDRAQDVEGARAHGLDCLGAGWGYGDPGELEDAVAVYSTPADLADGLRARAASGSPDRGADGPEPHRDGFGIAGSMLP
jgi:phosphoglycolate phosphatase